MSVLDELNRELKAKKSSKTETPAVQKTGTDKIADLRNKLSDRYLRVGVSYFKRIERQNANKTITQDLGKWGLTTLNDDFDADLHEINKIALMIKGERLIKIPELVPKFDAFCNEPNNDNFQQTVLGSYNLYNQITHVPIALDVKKDHAEIQTIVKLLCHLFGKDIEIIVDYLTILWRFPKHILPIICLVSKENQTGKTTFLKLLQAIWQENAVILSNQDFQTEFNSHYISKNLIMIDESFVELEKRKEKERIKQLGTATTAYLQFKGVDRSKIDYCGKLIMTSNHEDNFMKIEEEDLRFWVIKANVIQDLDPNFEDNLMKEIPYFIDFLKKRKITHEKKERHWFDSKLLITEARTNIINKTKNMSDVILDEFFLQIAYNIEDFANEIKVSIKDVYDMNLTSAKYLDFRKIKEYLTKKAQLPTSKAERYKLYPLQNGNTAPIERVGRPYVLLCSDFLPKADIQDNQAPAKQEEVLPF